MVPKTIRQIIRETVAYCAEPDAECTDPVEALKDYFDEHSSHFTRAEIRIMIGINTEQVTQ